MAFVVKGLSPLSPLNLLNILLLIKGPLIFSDLTDLTINGCNLQKFKMYLWRPGIRQWNIQEIQEIIMYCS